MNKAERMATANGLICVLDILKVLINPYVMKDEKLIYAAMDYIKNTEKQLKVLNNDEECISEVFVRYEKLSKENKQLKYLLKECKDRLDTYYDELRKKIDEALK